MRQQMELEKSDHQQLDGNDRPVVGDGYLRRNDRGCKSKDFYNWPEQSFEDMDSPLAVQQYIQQLINRNPADIDEILRLPDGQDLGAWKIEHLRLFCMQLNRLAAKLQDCCQPETCNQMTATEQWIFLCAAHKQPNECPAIDYTRHTLDGAANLLNSNKYFPSRVTIKENSVAKLSSVCRRVYRIFSHAYYHHFQVFDEFERDTHLCKRFSKFVTIYDLMPKDSLIVPADGSKPEIEQEKQEAVPMETTVIDGKVGDPSSSESKNNEGKDEGTEYDNNKMDSKTIIDKDVGANVDSSSSIKLNPKKEEISTLARGSNSTSNKTATTTTTSTQQAVTTTGWSPSQISTNTMVKSATSRATSSALNSPMSETKKQTEPDIETAAIKSTTTEQAS